MGKVSQGGGVDRSEDIERVFRENGPDIWRAVYVYAGRRREIADDAVAEAFARALANGRPIVSPAAWIYRTAFRLAGREMKSERRRSEASAHRSAERSDSAEETSDITMAIRKLSPGQRAAVFLFYQAGFTTSQIAEVTGSSVPTVRVHLFRGRRRLRQLLGAEEVTDA